MDTARGSDYSDLGFVRAVQATIGPDDEGDEEKQRMKEQIKNEWMKMISDDLTKLETNQKGFEGERMKEEVKQAIRE